MQTTIKAIIKICVDIAMTVLFLLLMEYHLSDGLTHEWLGIALFVLFVTHNALNYKWYLALFKGKYGAVRIMQTVVNVLLLLVMICCIVSAIYVSGYVFSWIDISSVSFGRNLHLTATVWAFIFASFHLGFHWAYFVGKAKKIKLPNNAAVISKWVFRVIVLAIYAYGCYNFIVRKLWEEMFLLTEFKWFDFDKNAFLYFVETSSIMIMFAACSYYLKKSALLIGKIKRKKSDKSDS